MNVLSHRALIGIVAAALGLSACTAGQTGPPPVTTINPTAAGKLQFAVGTANVAGIRQPQPAGDVPPSQRLERGAGQYAAPHRTLHAAGRDDAQRLLRPGRQRAVCSPRPTARRRPTPGPAPTKSRITTSAAPPRPRPAIPTKASRRPWGRRAASSATAFFPATTPVPVTPSATTRTTSRSMPAARAHPTRRSSPPAGRRSSTPTRTAGGRRMEVQHSIKGISLGLGVFAGVTPGAGQYNLRSRSRPPASRSSPRPPRAEITALLPAATTPVVSFNADGSASSPTFCRRVSSARTCTSSTSTTATAARPRRTRSGSPHRVRKRSQQLGPTARVAVRPSAPRP